MSGNVDSGSFNESKDIENAWKRNVYGRHHRLRLSITRIMKPLRFQRRLNRMIRSQKLFWYVIININTQKKLIFTFLGGYYMVGER